MRSVDDKKEERRENKAAGGLGFIMRKTPPTLSRLPRFHQNEHDTKGDVTMLLHSYYLEAPIDTFPRIAIVSKILNRKLPSRPLLTYEETPAQQHTLI